MPIPSADPRHSASLALPAMGALAQSRSEAARNLANGEQLKAWLDSLLLDRLGARVDGERGAACSKWLMSVGRKWMIRHGQARDYAPVGAELDNAPAWARKALAEGSALQALSLPNAERDLLARVLDWMRADTGPSLASDWSKISVDQALEAEAKWVEAMSRAALKTDLEQADALGVSLMIEIPGKGPDKRSGWRWVEVRSRGALDREGALMRHCVGSYAEDVSTGNKAVFSLRDPDNKPRLTLEAQQGRLTQLKAFANQPCPRALRSQVVEFAQAFAARGAQQGWDLSTSFEVEQAGVVALPGLGAFGAREESPSDTLRGLLFSTLSAGPRPRYGAPSELLPSLCSLGWREFVEMALPKASLAAVNDGLLAAAAAGMSEIVELLLPRADPRASGSQALILAAEGGHADVVKTLLPLSNPFEDDCYALTGAARGGHIKALLVLLAACSPVPERCEALAAAARAGQMEALETLLPSMPSQEARTSALMEAAESGRVEAVKRLSPLSDPLEIPYALRLAASRGHLAVVSALTPLLAPCDDASDALVDAARQGHAEIVAALLPFSNPRFERSAALRGAIEHGHEAVAMTLLCVSDPFADYSEELRVAKFSGHLDMALRMEQTIAKLTPEPAPTPNLPHKIQLRRGRAEAAPHAPAGPPLAPPTR